MGRIEFLAGCGCSVEQIAKDYGKSPSMIGDGHQHRRVSSDKLCGCSNKHCAHYDKCKVPVYGATGKGLRKNTAKCFETCPNFREAACLRLSKARFACNGCEREHNCPLQ